MLDFYRDVRADGCSLDEDGDMLLIQWGRYNSRETSLFQVAITRQFIVADTEALDDSEISQLSFTFHFSPSAQFDILKVGNQWCNTPNELEDFKTFIMESAVYQKVSTEQTVKVTLEYDRV